MSYKTLLTAVIVVIFALSACTLQAGGGGASNAMRVWLDQPPNGYALPLEPFPLMAHARQPGGGVMMIRFVVNGVELGSASADASLELTQATLEWNPSAPGVYVIRAVAVNTAGQEASSEPARVCVGDPEKAACSGMLSSEEGTEVTVAAQGDGEMKVGANPDRLAIGAGCTPGTTTINFEGYVADLQGAIEVHILGVMVNQSGESREFSQMLTAGSGGSYSGAYILSAGDMAFFASGEGKILYRLALLNDQKEWFRQSDERVIAVEPCKGEQAGGKMIKIGGVPNPVYIGSKCSASQPTAINFEAGTDIAAAQIARVDLGYVWFDQAGTWIGTAGVENRAAMTPTGGGGYTYRLNTSSAPAQLASGGSVKYRAIVVGTGGTDIAFSEMGEIQIVSCAAGVTPQQPTRTPTKPGQPPVQQPTPTFTVPAPPPQPTRTFTVPPPPPPPSPGAIQGMVYYDSDGDGKCDSAWSFGGFSVTAGGGYSDVGKDGFYYIGPVDPGSYTVTLNHPGYSTIGPDSVKVSVGEGQTATADFCVASIG